MPLSSSAKAIAFIASISLSFIGTPLSAGQVKEDVPLAVQQAFDLGAIDSQEEMTLTVHLNMTRKEAFDKAVDALYDPRSPTYERWMTDEEMQAYAPSAAAVAKVKAELVKHGLSIVSVDPLGFSIRVHGTAENIQQAFQTRIHQYTLRNKAFRAHLQTARLTGGADAFVHSISGLDGRHVRPMIKRAVDPRTRKVAPRVQLAKVNLTGGLGSYITDNCFTAPKAYTFTSFDPLPVGVFFGNVYDDTTKTCAFTSAQLQAHYGLAPAYAKGYDGHGQTIVLMEAYGYPTILADANAFSKLSGLPQLNASNFEIIYPEGKPRNPNAGVILGWDEEIALDVQWAHTIAPKAKLLVVAVNGQDNEDFQDAINYVVAHKLGNSISNSWEADSEMFAGPAEVNSFNVVLQRAAAKGVSVNFSSGDGGDDGNGGPIGSPEVPSDSPYATAVGGTAILNKFNGSTVEVGWGNVGTILDSDGLFDPPLQIGFLGGAGGGESVFLAKPKWQAALPGTGRQVPDVSALSDPYTGVAIVVTQSGIQYLISGIGGTSLGCPIFSAFWVLANQAAGHSLGQAAPRLAKMMDKQLVDVLPVSSPTNVAGTIFESTGPIYYSPFDLLSEGIQPPNVKFVSAIWPIGDGEAHDEIAFGLDSTLSVTRGWDNVTGFGVPNGLTFIEGAGK